MIMDNKGKIFGKVSIVDLLIVLIVIVGILGIFFTKSKLDNQNVLINGSDMLVKTSTETDKLEIKLKVKEVRDITRDAIIVGDNVYVSVSGEFLGVVSRVESEPAIRDVVANNGTAYSAVVPDRYDVTIIVDADGKKKADGYFTASNIHLLYGKDMEIKTSTIQTTPKVVGITVAESSK